jgi:hypothetical protein
MQWQAYLRINSHWYNVLLAVGLAMLLAVAFAWSTKPSPKSAAIEPVPSFEQRFGEEPPPKRVRTIPIVRLTPEVTVEEIIEPLPTAPRRRLPDSDVCKRHGMKKVMIDRYRWRCRR